MRTVDILVVGMAVGAAGVAAVGIGDAVARLVLFTGLGLGAGAIAAVSQALGAGDQDRADLAATHSALLALGLGVPFALAGWFGAEPMYDLLGADSEVLGLGVSYLRIVLLSRCGSLPELGQHVVAERLQVVEGVSGAERGEHGDESLHPHVGEALHVAQV